jgi:hypothetical protein
MTEAEQKNDPNFAVLSAMLKAGMKPKPKLSAVEYAASRGREGVAAASLLWRVRRQRRCGGEAAGCLRRALDRVPHPKQWQARQDILESTPRNIGAPERAARQCMPRDLYES